MYDNHDYSRMQALLNKVPEITLYFWIIKVLCTTVGETFSDFLDVNLGLGLTGTSIVMGILLVVALIFQFRSKKYTPGIYWMNVVLISVFGTLVTDNLTDAMGVPLELSTIVFTILLALTFAIWYMMEGTLSIHSITTWQREAFYWLAILFTFALGTASGDLMAESLGLGYLVTGLIVCAIILAVIIARRLGLDSVLSFWLIYIMTRPLGASIGDYLSQSTANGGLGLGATITSIVFLLAILFTVVYLAVTKKDAITRPAHEEETRQRGVIWQVIGVAIVLAILSFSGYYWRVSSIQKELPTSVSETRPLGDLSEFKNISEDTLALVRAGNLNDAKTRITDLETAWDNAEAKLRLLSPDDWGTIDDAIDKTLRNLRAVKQDPKACESSLVELIDTLDLLDQSQNDDAPSEKAIPDSRAISPPVEETSPQVASTEQKDDANSDVSEEAPSSAPAVISEPETKNNTVQTENSPALESNGPLGDLSEFRNISDDTLTLVRASKLDDAKNRITDLETAWDDAEATLRRMDGTQWRVVDKAIDTALRQLRASHPDTQACDTALVALIETIDKTN